MLRLARQLLSLPLLPRRPRPIRHTSPLPFRPRFDALEDRVVPSRPLPDPVIYVGAEFGAPPTVKAYNAETGVLNFERTVYELGFTGGVHVATADISRDHYPDLIVGPGEGGGPRIRVFDGKTGLQIPGPLGNFWAYSPLFTGGVEVAAGDVNGDYVPDIITAAGFGGGPHIKVFDGKTGDLIDNFFAFSPDFTGGVHVAAADFNGDLKADIVLGAGYGGGPHIKIYDVSTGKVIPGPLGNFFAFDPDSRSGVHVGTDVYTGDVTGDGKPDLLVGTGKGMGPQIKVYDGVTGLEVRNFQAFDKGMKAGVRPASAFVTDDEFADIIVGTGKGEETRVRVFDGVTTAQLPGVLGEYQPFGANSKRGVFVAASNDPLAQVSVRNTPGTEAGSKGYFQITRTGGAGYGTLTVYFAISGTAKADLDYEEITATSVTFDFSEEPETEEVVVVPIDDCYVEEHEEGLEEYVTMTLLSGDYEIVGDGYTDLGIADNDDYDQKDPQVPCVDCAVPVNAANSRNEMGPTANATTETGLTIVNGLATVSMQSLSGTVGSNPIGFTPVWSNGVHYWQTESQTILGDGFLDTSIPILSPAVNGGGSAMLIADPRRPQLFDVDEWTGIGSAKFFDETVLRPNSTTGDTEIIDGTGQVFAFYPLDYSTTNLRGLLRSRTSPDGTVMSITSRNAKGQPTEVQQTVGDVIESLLYTYGTSEHNKNQITSVTLRKKIGSGSWSTVRSMELTYDTTIYERARLLKTTLKNESGTTLSEKTVAYTDEICGALISYVMEPDNNNSTSGNPEEFADAYFEYDGDRRITEAVLSGLGCSTCTGGQGTYTYTYTTSSFSAGHNNWAVKTLETCPDGREIIYYSNAYGQLLAHVRSDEAAELTWIDAYRYDSDGRLLAHAYPSAVTDIDEGDADLVDWANASSNLLANSAGLIDVYEYGSSTTATSSTAGNVEGRLKRVAIQHGDTATAIVQQDMNYLTRTVSSLDFVIPANYTQYRNDNTTGGQTTSMAYTWLSSTFRVASVTTTLPTVTTAQNGPNSATSYITVFDAQGRPTWSKDPAGFISYTEYDESTGAVVKQITDVNTATTSDFSNLPSGWSTPSGGGLHLKTLYEVDNRGRTIKVTAPNGRVDYTVYNDVNHEVRYYPGWNSSTNTPTGPTTVTRDDWTNNYQETLSMTATPNVSGGRPTGTESISGLVSLSRSHQNEAGQTLQSDSYFNLSGLTYSTSASLGTLNTHYYRTEYKYDQNGRLEKTTSPLGTISRTVFDALGRSLSQWVGTDDIPTSGSWSPTNTAGTNLVKVSEVEYDGGGVGNSNVTSSTQFPGGGAEDRVTETYFDWRNRSVAVKVGVSSSEVSSTNRPIYYYDYDNLNQVTKTRMYDGDAESVTSTNEVPNAPTASKLRAQSTSSFDELGRVYLSEVYFVNPNTGDLTTNTNTLKSNTWYDSRGLVIKTSSPGGLAQKTVYDGAGRVTTSYVTDGGGDSGYSDADDVTGDKVLEQSEPAYDSSGNVLSTTHRQRFHDETGTGALGTASSGVKARVSYSANYYDVGDRLTATADYGTYGASSWSRPSTVASRSDTVLVTSFDYDSAGRTWKVTDPKGIESRTEYDALGRTTKTIENYVDGTVGDDNDKTTEYTYNAAGMTTLTAKLTGGGGQTTEWIYGVSSGTGSTITSNDIVGATRWPDPSTGSASSSQQDTVTVNALGQTLTSTDRNGTVHTYVYTVLGQVFQDQVTTLGSGVDGTVRRIETYYYVNSQPGQITSYSAASGGTVINEVVRTFTGLGQIAREYQGHDGAVNTSSDPFVSYEHSEMTGGANHNRLVNLHYPNGTYVTHNYASGLDNTISRLSSLELSSTVLEEYSYLGLGTVVVRAHPQPGVDLSFVKLSGESVGDAGDQYTGLDRFGRIVDQRWRAGSTDKDRYQYTYDRNGNRLTRNNQLDSNFNETYTYDNLNQLSSFSRTGRSQSWDYDAVGNWDSFTTNSTTQTRTHNKQNEITAVGGATTPTFDANGNMTTDETGKQYEYDAWNRLVRVKTSGGSTLVAYEYDGLTRRIQETASSVTTDLYYSLDWQVLEERVSGSTTKTYVWSPVYVDAMVLRNRDTDANGSLDERLYVTHDANFNVTGLVNTSGTVVERSHYDPFGVKTVRDGSWTLTSTAYAWEYYHQGGRFSTHSELYHFRYREYSPTLGRWVTMDPIGYRGGDANEFRYTRNNSIALIDPSGLQPPKSEFCEKDKRVLIPFGVNRSCYAHDMLDAGYIQFWGQYCGRSLAYEQNVAILRSFKESIAAPVRTAVLLAEMPLYCNPNYQPIHPGAKALFNGEQGFWPTYFGITLDLAQTGLMVAPYCAPSRAAVVASECRWPSPHENFMMVNALWWERERLIAAGCKDGGLTLISADGRYYFGAGTRIYQHTGVYRNIDPRVIELNSGHPNPHPYFHGHCGELDAISAMLEAKDFNPISVKILTFSIRAGKDGNVVRSACQSCEPMIGKLKFDDICRDIISRHPNIRPIVE